MWSVWYCNKCYRVEEEDGLGRLRIRGCRTGFDEAQAKVRGVGLGLFNLMRDL